MERDEKGHKPEKLTVDLFRCLRPLLGDAWRRRLMIEALTTKGADRMTGFKALARRVEKAMWVSFHWSPENPHIHETNGVWPYLACLGLCGFGLLPPPCMHARLAPPPPWLSDSTRQHVAQAHSTAHPAWQASPVRCPKDLPPCPTDDNEVLRKQFTTRVHLADLRQRLPPNWTPSTARPRPLWEKLAGAAVYRLDKYKPLLETLKKAPVAVEVIQSGRVLTLVADVEPDTAPRSLTIYKCDQPPGPMPSYLATTRILCGLLEASGPSGFIPGHITHALITGAPVLVYGPTALANWDKDAILKNHPGLAALEVTLYRRPGFLNPSATHTFDTGTLWLLGMPGENIDRSVCTLSLTPGDWGAVASLHLAPPWLRHPP